MCCKNLKKDFLKRNIILLVGIMIGLNTFGQTLELTPNECFFSPTKTLLNVQDPAQTGTEANSGAFFTHITNWSKISDTIIWAVDITKPGDISITPWCGVSSTQANSSVDVYLGDNIQTISLVNATGFSNFQAQETADFSVTTPGRYILKLRLNHPVSGGNVGDVQKVVLSGTAIDGASTVIKRWRPYAVHTKWGVSTNPSTVSLAVHKNTIVTTNTDMYQPITTPFGYVGSTWDKEKQQFNGFNFSLWSYGANDPEPPIEQLSHLIAVGKGLTFGEYGHEGTGVKPRGDNPYEGYHGTSQVLAVRKEPGNYYDTYYAYYLDPVSEHWKLWGCGKKYNSSSTIKYLWTGAFVEQPGAPNKERSGDKMREVNYRGWYMDKDNSWYNIDQMEPGGSLSSISFKKWGKTENNSFLMQMGGFGENNVRPDLIELNGLPSVDNRPDYLKDDRLSELFVLPAEVNMLEPKSVEFDSCILQFDILKQGTNAEAELFWGTTEGLTFDYKWKNKQTVPITQGINEYSLTGLIPGQAYYYRLRITNDEGTTWSMDTQKFTTTVPEGMVLADFNASKTSIFLGKSVTFANTSIPINNLSFDWTFEGGEPSTSNEQNPVVTYNTLGTFDVTLNVTNNDGTDTKTWIDCITVTENSGSGSLQGHFEFDNSLFDISPYQRDLTIIGDFTPRYVADRNSSLNSAYQAPGNNDQYLTNDYNGIAANGERTVTAWFNTNTGNPSRKTIVSWGENAEGQMFNVMLQNDGTVRVEAGSCSVRSTKAALNDNNWHHVAVTYNPADGDKLNDVKIYIDGIFDTNQSDADASYRSEEVSINTDNTENNMRIGSVKYANYYWIGSLDDIRIYNTCLSESEILVISGLQTGFDNVKNDKNVLFISGNSMIKIKLFSQLYGDVYIYDIKGSLIEINRLQNGMNTIPLKQGIYIARVIARNVVTSEKVISF